MQPPPSTIDKGESGSSALHVHGQELPNIGNVSADVQAVQRFLILCST